MCLKDGRRLLAGVAGAAIAAQLIGCATSDFDPSRVTRPPVAVPERFLVALPNDGGPRPARADEGCRNPMVDPDTGMRIRMVRSSQIQGDYAVPDSAYGLESNELLRLDCGNGRVIGVVTR